MPARIFGRDGTPETNALVDDKIVGATGGLRLIQEVGAI
jgi:hypothetical protein